MNLFHHDDDITAQFINRWLDAFKDDDEGNSREENRVVLYSGFTMISILLELSVDLYQEAATNAQTNVDYIVALLESAFARLKGSQLLNQIDRSSAFKNNQIRSRMPSPSPPPRSLMLLASVLSTLLRPTLSRSYTMTSTISIGVTNTIKRASSFANPLKNLVLQHYDGRVPPNHATSNKPGAPTTPIYRPQTSSSRNTLHHALAPRRQRVNLGTPPSLRGNS